MWEIIYKYILQVKIYNMLLPTTKYPNDSNIMETAIHDSRFLGKIKLKLKLINNYRMYLGVVYVSEITDNGGRV